MTDINKRFADLAGICWHECYTEDESTAIIPCCSKCGRAMSKVKNIDYSSDPLAVLLVMREKLDDPDWVRFVDNIGEAMNWPKDGPSARDMVRIDLLLNPGAMVKAAVDYLANVQRNDGKS